MSRKTPPFDMWENATQLGLIASEAQAVITMRMWGMAGLWEVTDSENARMVNEKTEALTQSMMDASAAILTGKRPDQVLAAAIEPVRRKTRANSKRLAKRGPKLG